MCRIYPQANIINNNRTYSVITTLHLLLPPCAYYIHHMHICFYPHIFYFGFYTCTIILLQYRLVILYLCYYHNAFCVSVTCCTWYTMVISWYMNFNTMVLVNVLLYIKSLCHGTTAHFYEACTLFFSCFLIVLYCMCRTCLSRALCKLTLPINFRFFPHKSLPA